MPWEVTGPVRERERFIEAYLTGSYTITELTERFGRSRQKLHKWLARHDVDGMKRPRRSFACSAALPHRTSEDVAEQIIAFRGVRPEAAGNDRSSFATTLSGNASADRIRRPSGDPKLGQKPG